MPKRFRESGYAITLFFFGLASTKLSEMRVVERSKSGGHYVHPLEVESNFYGNLKKLNQYFAIIDNLQIVDTSETIHTVLLKLVDGKIDSCMPYNELPDWFIEGLPNLTEKIRLNQ